MQQSPYKISIGRSRQLAAFLGAVHLAACLSLIPLAVPVWGKCAASLVLLVSVARTLRRDALVLSAQAVCEIVLGAAGELEFRQRDGSSGSAKAMPQSVVFPGLAVLVMREGASGRRRNLIILPDAVNAESLRRLRIWLVWHSEQ